MCRVVMRPPSGSAWSRCRGVARVVARDSRDGNHAYEVESLPGHNVRGDVARAVVEAGWNLNELHAVAMSLEDVFLELTSTVSEGAQQ